MDKVEAVRLALAELGDASSEEVAAFVSQRFGLSIEARFVPVFKATVRDRESLERIRQEARAVALAAAAESPPTAKGRKSKKRPSDPTRTEPSSPSVTEPIPE